MTFAVIKAPTKVPITCAKNGNKKCFGSNKCIAAFKSVSVVTSIPFGAGMILPPKLIID